MEKSYFSSDTNPMKSEVQLLPDSLAARNLFSLKGISFNRYLLLVLFLFPFSILGAKTLKGKVLARRQPLSYATVRLLSPDSTFVQGTRTDSTGVFSLRAVQPGRYLLHVSSIGYLASSVSVDLQHDTHLPPITLQLNSIALKEVTVNASSYVREEDKLLIYPDKQQVKHSFTGYDLLYRLMIPGMDVDRIGGKVTSMGKEASLYIDGQPVGFREVQSLRPRDIEKVEYHDMPSGKYADDFVAINFITKKYTSGGYVSLDGKQTIGYLNGDYNGVAKLNRGNTDYTLFVGHQQNRYDGETEDMNENFHFPNRDVVRHTATLENRVKNNSQYAQFNVKHNGEKRSLSAKLSLVCNDAPDNYIHNLLEYSDNSGDRQEGHKYTDQSGLMPSLDLYGYFNLNEKQFLEVNLSGNYNRNNYTYNYKEGSFSSWTDVHEDYYTLYGQVIHNVTFNKHHSLNTKVSHRRLISSMLYEGTSPSWQHLWNGETVALFGYKYKLGKGLSVKLAPGFSFSQYRLHGDKQENRFSPRFQTRIRFTPAHNHTFALDGEIKNYNPRIERFNTAEQVIDSLQIKRGNPVQNVMTSYIAMLSYSMQLKDVNLTLLTYYEKYKNMFIPFYYIEGDKMVQTNHSNAMLDGVAMQLSLGWKVTDNFRLKASGMWMYIDYAPYSRQKLNTVSGRMQADYYWKDFSFSAYGETRTETMQVDFIHTTTPARYGLFAAWSHGGWHVEAGADNLFIKRRDYKYVFDSDVYDYNRTAHCRINQQTGYVKVAYTFDFGRKTSRDKRDVNTNINSAILKAN